MERLLDVDDLCQKVLGGAVEPLKILEQQDQRRQPATRLQQLPQEILCAQTDQQAIQTLQGPLRGFETKQIEQEAETFGGP